MREVIIEFPVIGYAELKIQVPEDMDNYEIEQAIEDGDIDVVYNGHSHAESLIPLTSMLDARNFEDVIPFRLKVVE